MIGNRRNSTQQADVVSIDNQMKVYLRGGCNSIVLCSNDNQKAIIVDTKHFYGAKKLRAAISAPKITIINTHFHMDHARGNKLYPTAYVISGDTNWKQWDIDTSHSKHPDKILYPGESFLLRLDDELIHIVDFGKAHSPNDLIVYFEKRKLIAVGDLVWPNKHPVLLDKNVNFELWISYLGRMISDFDIEIVVPGHGEITGKDSILKMKEYFGSITSAINSHEELKKLKHLYSNYSTFPIFGRFSRTTHIMRREIKKGNQKARANIK